VSAKSAILISADSGKILYAKNALQPHYPASITKIATGLYTLMQYPHLMDKRVSCPAEALRTITEAEKCKGNYSKYPSYVLEKDMSHMGLKVGEEMTFRDLLLGTLIVSADDASNVLAHTAANGDIEAFMQGMNAFIARLGLKNTKFLNPHGLHHPEHVSCAYDLALLCRAAMRHPMYAEITKMPAFKRPRTNKQEAVTLHHTIS
jgi:D-alanyl-D-alanine carboxypeptidase (penicillin-binding protein 5/6)